MGTTTKRDIECVNAWLEWQRRERGRSTTTLYQYSREAERLVGFLVERRRTSVGGAGVDDLRAWVFEPVSKGRRAGLEPSVSTVRRRVAMCRSLFGFLRAEGVLGSDPSLRLASPRMPVEKPKPVDAGVWRRLWASDLSDSDRIAFGLGLFCGLRRAEIVTIRGENVTNGGVLAGFARKGGKQGKVPWVSCVKFLFQQDPTLFSGSIESFTDPLLEATKRRRNDWLLLDWSDNLRKTAPVKYRPSGLDPQHVNRHLEAALVEAGLAGDACTPHQLRHGFGTLMVDYGVPLLEVSRLMGHSSVTVTQRYVQTAEDPLAKYLTQDVTSVTNDDVTVNAYNRI